MGISDPCSPVTPTPKLPPRHCFPLHPQAAVSADEEEDGEVPVPGEHVHEPPASPQGAGLPLALSQEPDLPVWVQGAAGMGKRHLAPRRRLSWVRIPALPLTSCVTSAPLLPCFPIFPLGLERVK